MKRSEITARIGHALRRARKAKHLTQQDISERTGMARSVVGKYETGDIEISMANFITLCDAIGVNPETIFREARQ